MEGREGTRKQDRNYGVIIVNKIKEESLRVFWWCDVFSVRITDPHSPIVWFLGLVFCEWFELYGGEARPTVVALQLRQLVGYSSMDSVVYGHRLCPAVFLPREISSKDPEARHPSKSQSKQ